MLFAATSFMLSQSHAMSCGAAAAFSVLKIICRIGIMAANENMLSTADRMLNDTVMTRYLLYGGTKRLSIWKNSFI